MKCSIFCLPGLINIAFLRPTFFTTLGSSTVIPDTRIVDGLIDCTASLPYAYSNEGRESNALWEIDLEVYVQIIGVRLYFSSPLQNGKHFFQKIFFGHQMPLLY